MSRIWQVLSAHGLDVLIVVTALAGALGTVPMQGGADLKTWLEAAAIALAVLAMLARRQHPFAAPAATWLLSAAISFLDGELIVGQPAMTVAGMAAAVLLGDVRNARQARIGLAVVVAGAVVVVYNDPAHSAGDPLFIPLTFAIGWLVGYALREQSAGTEAAEQRAAQAERDRESAARVAVAEERARIARELHDIVAHAVSVMVLQVGAVRHRMSDRNAEDREALKNVEQAGRTALAEMRRLLDAMRHEGDELELVPHPGLHDLESLLTDVRAAGLDVRLHVHGEPTDLPPGLDLSAYRIVQEGLTNTLKHAHASRADVDLEYGGGELRIKVRDNGRGLAPTERAGHGLVGIGERVKIFGGDMLAAPSEAGGGFELSARLPLNGRLS